MTKLKIDQEKCIGCALCSSICPEVFGMDEKIAKAFVKKDAKIKGNEKEIDEAIDMCPSTCISKS